MEKSVRMDGASASSSGVTACKRKRSAGRQKIAIEPIQNEAARQVSFSKRRNGLFKKARELTVLCGANIKVVVFSPAGNPYSFIHTSDSPRPTLVRHVSLPDRPTELEQNSLLSELESSLHAAKRKIVDLKGCLCGADVEGLEMVYLERFKADFAVRYDELSIVPYVIPVPVPIQDGFGSDGFYCGDNSYAESVPVPIQDGFVNEGLCCGDNSYAVPIQDGFVNEGFCCGDNSSADLFSLDDFYYGGDFGQLC